MLLDVLVVAIVVLVLLVEYWARVVRWLMDRAQDYRAARIARVEAELDRKQAELRATMLQLSEALTASAHETRRAMIRESFLAHGQVLRERS